MHRGHRARLYPAPEQARALGRWAGCARLLWNIALDQRRWGRGHPIGETSQCRELTGLRAEVDWLAELPAQAAQQVFAELDLAFQRHWRGLAGYPRRKKKGVPPPCCGSPRASRSDASRDAGARSDCPSSGGFASGGRASWPGGSSTPR